jgi:hypothetical protein
MIITPQLCLPGLGTVISSCTNIMVIPALLVFMHSRIFSTKYVTVTMTSFCFLNMDNDVTVAVPLIDLC